MADIYELYNNLHRSNGYKIFHIQRNLEVTKEIVDKNYKELIKAANTYEKYVDKLPMGKTFSSRRAKGFRREFLRLLLAYLSSVYALENNIRHFFKITTEKVEGLSDKDFILNNPKIIKELSSFTRSPERILLYAIRNYIEHSKILDISNAIGYFKENGVMNKKGEFNLKKSLMTHDLIRSYSLFLREEEDRKILLPYIRKSYPNSSIDIKQTVITGQSKVDSLWNKIQEIITKDYGDVLEESKKIHQRMIRLLYQMFEKKK